MRSYDSLRITVDDTDKDSLMNMIRQTLDSGIPAIAAKTSHAMTLIGYDKEKQTVTIWDQRMPNMKKRDDLPMGAQELILKYKSNLNTLAQALFEEQALDGKGVEMRINHSH